MRLILFISISHKSIYNFSTVLALNLVRSLSRKNCLIIISDFRSIFPYFIKRIPSELHTSFRQAFCCTDVQRLNKCTSEIKSTISMGEEHLTCKKKSSPENWTYIEGRRL